MIGILLSFVPAIFSFFGKRSDAKTQEAIEGLKATVEHHRIASQERTALLWPWVYSLLTLLIVGPPALHWCLVYLDTLLTASDWAIPKAPEPYATYEFQMLFGFLGIGGIGGIATAVINRFRR